MQLSKDHYAQHPDVEHFREDKRTSKEKRGRKYNRGHEESDDEDGASEQDRSAQSQDRSEDRDDDKAYELSGYGNTFLADEATDEEQREAQYQKDPRNK